MQDSLMAALLPCTSVKLTLTRVTLTAMEVSCPVEFKRNFHLKQKMNIKQRPWVPQPPQSIKL